MSWWWFFFFQEGIRNKRYLFEHEEWVPTMYDCLVKGMGTSILSQVYDSFFKGQASSRKKKMKANKLWVVLTGIASTKFFTFFWHNFFFFFFQFRSILQFCRYCLNFFFLTCSDKLFLSFLHLTSTAWCWLTFSYKAVLVNILL